MGFQDKDDLKALRDDGILMLKTFRDINERNYLDLNEKKRTYISDPNPNYEYLKQIDAALGEVIRFRSEISEAEIEILKLSADETLLEYFQIMKVIEKTTALKNRILKMTEFT